MRGIKMYMERWILEDGKILIIPQSNWDKETLDMMMNDLEKEHYLSMNINIHLIKMEKGNTLITVS